MEKSKAKYAAKSIWSGTINRLVTMIFPFIVRTMMIYTIGAQYLGLSSIFTSILQILSFTELGIGNVMVFSMYKPIAENDTATICALYNLYKRLYRIIGTVMLGIGLAILPMINHFVSGEAPADINLYVLYLVYLFNSVISYWLFAYKDALISAHQKYYLSSNVSTFSSMFLYIGQMVALLFFRNYYVYICFLPLSTILNNIGIAFAAKKEFPHYLPYGQVAKEMVGSIRKTVLASIGHKLGPAATNSIDNLVISSYLGLTAIAVFSNYNYILTVVTSFITLIFNSFVAGIGNSIVTESREKNYHDFMTLTFINNWITGWCAVCLICLYQHFMWLWIGHSNGGAFMYSDLTVVLLVIMFYMQQIRTILTTYKSAAGMWYADRMKPYVSTVLNLILDLIFVRYFNVNGVIITTILARTAVGLPWETAVMFKMYFKQRQLPYYCTLFLYLVVTFFTAAATYFLCKLLPDTGVQWFVLKLIICLVLPNSLYLAIYWKREEFKNMLTLIKSMLRRNWKKDIG